MANTQDISSWISQFSRINIPVLRHTARALDELKKDESALSARAITTAVMQDPFMVFRIISYAKQHQGKRQLHDLIEVEQAILMMGTTTFYRDLVTDDCIEDQLKGNLIALTHLLKLIKRAHRAAYYAADWAALQKDLRAEEIRTAALLYDFAEMLMWCFAPEKMLEIFTRQQADKTLRSKAAQALVLGFKLSALQKELVQAFQLPPLLSSLIETVEPLDHRAKNVLLAVNLARHSANGWHDAALPDDYLAIAAFLHVDVDRVRYLIGVAQDTTPE